MADRPKRPLSAYMIWLNDHREQIKKENPGIKVTEIAKKGGELWRGLKDKSVSWNFAPIFFICFYILPKIFIVFFFLFFFGKIRNGTEKPPRPKTDTQN